MTIDHTCLSVFLSRLIVWFRRATQCITLLVIVNQDIKNVIVVNFVFVSVRILTAIIF